MSNYLKIFLSIFLLISFTQCGEDSDPKKILPTLSINDAAVQEGKPAVFTVTLSEVSTEIVTINYKTTHVTTLSTDLKSVTTSAVFIPVGETTVEIAIITYADAEEEASELFKVELFSPVNADLSDDVVGSGTINDGPKPFFMKMKVDGVQWTATQTFFFAPSFFLGSNSMAGYGADAFYDTQLSFVFNETPSGPKVYAPEPLTDDTSKVRVYWSPNFFSGSGFGDTFNGQPGGEVKFTKFDATKGEAEGTFHFTVKNDDNGDEVEITEGSFRILVE